MKQLKSLIGILFCSLSIAYGQGLTIHSGSNLVVSGNAAIVVNDGSFINNGTFNSGGGSLYMKGSAPTADSKIQASNISTFNHVVIDKAANGVQLENNINVNGNMDMQSGTLDLNGKILSFYFDGTILNETEANRILGDSGTIFKAGLLNNPSNVDLGNMGLQISSSQNLNVVYVRRIHGTQMINGTPSVTRQYQVEYFVPNLTMDYTMKYFDAELNGVNEAFLQSWKHDTAWNQRTADGLDTMSNIIQVSGVTELDTLWAFTSGLLQLSPKILLQGNYAGGGLMTDNLRTKNLIPTTEPYAGLGYAHVGGGGETIAPSVLTATGGNAIVDWVFLELRDKSNATTVIRTKSALLQSDGDIVDLDGTSPVTFGEVSPDDYYLVVRHRNHLGIRTPTAQALSPIAAAYDFTSNATQAFGSNSMAVLAGGGYGLWGGDANGDGRIYDNAIPSDAQEVSGAVLANTGNTGFFGSGPVSNYSGFTDTYDRRDLNMDGNIYDNFVPSDNTIISNSVLGHPSNTGFFGSGPVTNFSGLIEQIDP